jgi:uncharacterized protein YehS (DUF1456 family)
MNNNDVLRRFRYALDMSDKEVINAFKESGHIINKEEVLDLLKPEEEEGFVKCNNRLLGLFFDGVIIQKRGRQEVKAGETPKKPEPMSSSNINNQILKKIKIALNLKTEDMVAIWELADIYISNSDLTSLFRKKGQKNYKECLDKFLRTFLKGLAVKYRK